VPGQAVEDTANGPPQPAATRRAHRRDSRRARLYHRGHRAAGRLARRDPPRNRLMDLALLLQLTIFGLTDGAVVALTAVGFTLTYAVARQINLAHGSVFALTTVIVANLAIFAGVTGAAPLPVRVGGLI